MTTCNVNNEWPVSLLLRCDEVYFVIMTRLYIISYIDHIPQLSQSNNKTVQNSDSNKTGTSFGRMNVGESVAASGKSSMLLHQCTMRVDKCFNNSP